MGAAAAVLLRREREIVDTYRGVGATGPDRARRPEELDVRQNFAFQRLVQRAVLRDAADGRYYLDEPRWNALRRMRHRMAFVMLIVVILVAGGVIAFGAARGH